MADIHVKVVEGGYKVHRTEQSMSGATKRVTGVDVFVSNIRELHVGLPIFLDAQERKEQLGASNGN